ncbi:hypothetical protein [Pelagerythrobacter rhizovicinus]|uniref:Uncharacterized protein n=1 Tax=Pelagerythrobacter rhizovicinus TaxID=2268576 RepID=A0A4Q2KNF1_9SPHN|nr:hypothetical protein [Pelagerythrobacter rhizovicinus]RXZ66089.1 hypothetical protein ETX26_05080 [Pelagerythrobacter rhizovicinus]
MKALLASAALASLPLAISTPPVHARPDGETIESAVRFGLPALFAGFQATCSTELANDGYVARNGDRLAAKFTQGADIHWPAAKDALLTLGKGEGMDREMLAGMPDEALKPFVTALLQQMVSTEIKPSQCADVERGLELIDPLPADNIAGLIGFMVEMAERDEDADSAQAAGES